MVTPSGGRVELRQVGQSNIYESQDSSYTQLGRQQLKFAVVRTTDGTQFTFKPVTINSEYRCTQIKDRNGNYISATYNDNNGHLLTITDTLGRVITFRVRRRQQPSGNPANAGRSSSHILGHVQLRSGLCRSRFWRRSAG